MIEWLQTPLGIEFAHAMILLITACAAYVSYLAHKQASTNEKLLDGHIKQHILDAVERSNGEPK